MTQEKGKTIWEKEYLTFSEASKYLRRYRLDVHDLVARGLIEVVNDGPRPLVRRADLDALLVRLLEAEFQDLARIIHEKCLKRHRVSAKML